MGPRVQESQVAWTEVVAGRDERLIKKRWNLMKRASPKWKDRGINQIVRFCVGGAATWFISCVCCSSQAAFVAVSLHPCDTGCCCPAVAQAAARFMCSSGCGPSSGCGRSACLIHHLLCACNAGCVCLAAIHRMACI